MTLHRRIFLVIVVLFIMMFAGTISVNFQSTRLFLIQQLESHAQDTATSLGLSLSPHMQTADIPTMDTMVNAVFDRGYYQKISVEGGDQTPLIERTLELTIDSVPGWFIRLVPLEIPQAQAVVMSGWKPSATVFVQSHPGFAYQELWQTSTKMFVWFCVLAILTLGLAALMLRKILKPLAEVEHQAEAIQAREYHLVENIPKTRELRSVVLAMNRMTKKVKAMIEEQSRVAERLREQAFRDPVTGLGNRRHFDAHLEDELKTARGHQQGALLLVQIRGLRGTNERGGFNMGDELLRNAADILSSASIDTGQPVLSRIGGADFGLLIPGPNTREAEAIAAALCDKLTRLHTEKLVESPNCAHIGVAMYMHGRDPGELLSEADLALRAAQAIGPNAWQRHQSATDNQLSVRGRDELKSHLEDVIRQHHLTFYVQPIVYADRPEQLHHLEVLLRIPGSDGRLWNAEIFMPVAAQLGLAPKLDQLVLTDVLDRLITTPRVPAWAVNMSPASLRNPDFLDWLLENLAKRPTAAGKLVLEFAEYGAVRELDPLRQLGLKLRELGTGLALDHFARGFSPFGYLQSLQPDYVKIDAAYTGSISQDSDNRFFVGALCKVAHSLDIFVIAEAVEGMPDWNTLRELRFDGIQGYAVGPPIPFDEWKS